MKLKRFQTRDTVIIAVDYKSQWVPLNILNGFSDQTDIIEILDQWPTLKSRVEKELGQLDGNLPAIPKDAKTILPFEPKSFRDFMLSEKHAIDAARGLAKRFLPALYPIVYIYEKITGGTFPALKPKALWYKQPTYYMGNHLNFLTEDATIEWPGYTNALDYELELGFVITKPLKDAGREEALGAIGGFVIYNDISARDVQLAEMRSGFGPQKAKHFNNVMSAEIVTADEILPHVESLKSEVRINGELVCSTKPQFVHFSMADILMHASKGEQLHPGELFAIGTLPGGCALENPLNVLGN
jgi:hypothetical protein